MGIILGALSIILAPLLALLVLWAGATSEDGRGTLMFALIVLGGGILLGIVLIANHFHYI